MYLFDLAYKLLLSNIFNNLDSLAFFMFFEKSALWQNQMVIMRPMGYCKFKGTLYCEEYVGCNCLPPKNVSCLSMAQIPPDLEDVVDNQYIENSWDCQNTTNN